MIPTERELDLHAARENMTGLAGKAALLAQGWDLDAIRFRVEHGQRHCDDRLCPFAPLVDELPLPW